ncbi:MAG: RodZ domain-containing protein [Gammaproteobacteria bacterium]
MPDNGAGTDRSGTAGSTARTGAGGLALGERLRSARKARAISLERVAEELHLNESVVLALEEERFDELGAPVFVRGHLKAYAKLVGLSPELLLESYPEAEPQNLTLPPVERRVRRSVTINPVQWGFSALVLLLGLSLAVYVMQDDSIEVTPAAAPARSVSPPVTAVPPPRTLPETPATGAAAPQAEPVDAADEAQPEPVAETVSVPEAAETAPPGADLVRLELYFRAESWVEISDANRRLLFGLQREGRRRELVGEPPFRLLLGNAAGVDLSIDGKPYAVPSSAVTGQVARFEISAAAIE